MIDDSLSDGKMFRSLDTLLSQIMDSDTPILKETIREKGLLTNPKYEDIHDELKTFMECSIALSKKTIHRILPVIAENLPKKLVAKTLDGPLLLENGKKLIYRNQEELQLLLQCRKKQKKSVF